MIFVEEIRIGANPDAGEKKNGMTISAV